MQIKLKDGRSFELPIGEAKTDEAKLKVSAKYFTDTWLNGGETPGGDKIPWKDVIDAMKDMVSTTEVKALMSVSTQILIQEPVEPLLAIASLFTKVRAQGLDTKILLGAMGAVDAGDADEGGNYPEVQFDMGGGIEVATIGKSGIQASFSDEVLRYTTWDIMAIQLRLMAAAVARHTEFKAIKFLRSMGQTLYDNANPTRSVFGVLTGRDMSGAPNGTMTMDDIMTAYTHMVETGFTPDTLVMSPQMYFLWVRDPVLRHLFYQGNGGVFFATYKGNPAVLPGWSNGSIGGRGPSHGFEVMPAGNAAGETANTIFETSQTANSSPTLPSYLGIPLRTIVSPLIPYDPATKLGDIYLICSGMVGFHMIDEELITVEWRDEDRELTKVKMRQRDSFAVGWDGRGIAIFKHVKNGQNFFHGDVQLTQAVSGTITEIDADTAVV